MKPIDFVVAWVDGSDPEWLAEKERCTPSEGDGQDARFRDWDTLQYLFRAIEKFTPWVNRVHFVTWGHLPRWLNAQCPKLHVVNHRDFIPAEYLPTFSSRAIGLNLHRIPELSERFVYFNDDMFLLKPMAPERFFKNGLPADFAVLAPFTMKRRGDVFCATVANDMTLINANFKKRRLLRHHPLKYLNFRYGKAVRYTLASLAFPDIVGFWRSHYPQPFLKSVYEEIWAKEFPTLDQTCRRQLRTPGDVNDWLIRYWQLASGQFAPTSPNNRHYFTLGENVPGALDAIRSQAYDMICLNDNKAIEHIEEIQRKITEAFEAILPDKSRFER